MRNRAVTVMGPPERTTSPRAIFPRPRKAAGVPYSSDAQSRTWQAACQKWPGHQHKSPLAVVAGSASAESTVVVVVSGLSDLQVTFSQPESLPRTAADPLRTLPRKQKKKEMTASCVRPGSAFSHVGGGLHILEGSEPCQRVPSSVWRPLSNIPTYGRLPSMHQAWPWWPIYLALVSQSDWWNHRPSSDPLAFAHCIENSTDHAIMPIPAHLLPDTPQIRRSSRWIVPAPQAFLDERTATEAIPVSVRIACF
ncbi:hypothetical protein C8Q80DRAFT_521630 [Daedaleopsis nitida]|nr:hypothetical protein C8Q80DRAFT_521630 [Daedaleopsis nitida]